MLNPKTERKPEKLVSPVLEAKQPHYQNTREKRTLLNIERERTKLGSG